jgi:23S rRNA (uracil1939-C5)-methyltransferase
MVYGGSGLGRTEDEKVILMPLVLPDELVHYQDVLQKSGHLIGLPELIEDHNTNRIEPPCKYFGNCGGCNYQHSTYVYQMEFKQQIVKEQLVRIGGLLDFNIQAVVMSPKQFNYRNHAQFHIDFDGNLGFQRALSHDIVAVDFCHIVDDQINHLIASMKLDGGTGLERAAIRVDGMGDPVLMLSGKSPIPPEFEVDFPMNVLYRGPAGEICLSGTPINSFSILGKIFQVSAGSFFQINLNMAEKIVTHIMLSMDLENKPTVLDLYCGVGFFSAFLADKVGKLIGIESSESACDDFSVNLDEYDHIDLYQGNVEKILPSLDIRPDIVFIDPPRSGVAPKALQAIVQAQPDQIAYISCDPTTLARDLKELVKGGYTISSLTPFDMFPQTYHIETVTILQKAKA